MIQGSVIYQEILKEGIQQGLQQGIEQGLKQGHEQAFQQGREQGLKEGSDRGLREGLKIAILATLELHFIQVPEVIPIALAGFDSVQLKWLLHTALSCRYLNDFTLELSSVISSCYRERAN